MVGNRIDYIQSIHIDTTFTSILILGGILVLVFLNWFIEGIKWERLIRKIHYLGYQQVIASILLGLSANIIAPNRTGDLAARLRYIPKEKRWNGIYINFFSGSSQLLITFLVGLFSLAYFSNYLELLNSIAPSAVNALIFFLSLFSIFLFFQSNLLMRIFKYAHKKIQEEELKIVQISPFLKGLTFFFSVLRYLIFTLQFYLILLLLNSGISWQESSMALALIFFVNSFIPSNWLTDILSKGAISFFVFQLIGAEPLLGVTATFVLWFFNICIPSLMGLYFLKDINWVKSVNLNPRRC